MTLEIILFFITEKSTGLNGRVKIETKSLIKERAIIGQCHWFDHRNKKFTFETPTEPILITS